MVPSVNRIGENVAGQSVHFVAEFQKLLYSMLAAGVDDDVVIEKK